MTRLRRQALLCFLVPLAVITTLVGGAALTGRFQSVLQRGVANTDWFWIVPLVATSMVPPIWGYRLTMRLANALTDTAEAIRRLGEGKVPGAWVQMAAELPELLVSVDETALQLRDRLQSLLEEKGKLDAILAHMTEGVLLVDQRRRVLSINPAAERVFGVARTDALGRDHLEFSHDFDLDEKLNAVLSSGDAGSLEITRARPEEQVLECQLVPVRSEGHVTGVLMVLADITRFRRLERLRTEFVANVSHELRTPLTAISGFTETLLEGAGEDADTRQRFLSIMKAETDRLAQLINDLLDLSRIEFGRLKMNRRALDLCSLVADTVTRLSPRAQTAQVGLSADLPAMLPSVSGDADRLAQVLTNLVENGIKYTPAGGTVTVSARRAGGLVEVAVRDTGIGIDRSDLPRVFERFFRVDRGRSRASGGSGLGLAIVKHIVEAHGGRVWAESEKGKGSVFWFSLPIAA